MPHSCELKFYTRNKQGRPDSEEAAIKLASDSAKDVLRAFGSGGRILKRNYTLEELRLNRIEPEKLLSPTEETLSRLKSSLQVVSLRPQC